ncbi:Rieske (2Fe-2S) protein [Asticcacaulis sp. AND118]|uniref:Rieske (2Fe-2S) protein n=1 Tax=Asticcacaulis sp. AND118 TaxID=2840468 RepID=UPI001CFFD623|nr:Rieske (2Fe-2S) protein [Asticcacaulis sp. AND118]UDF04888.1 Rieske (2Fe-2S) protein [Asticcacaulis sp. AND118]
MNLAAPRLTQVRPGIALGPLAAVVDGRARNYVLQVGEARFHGFVVRRGDTASGYVDACPHAGLPLSQTLDDYLTPDGALIRCHWHGALFDIDDGSCLGGPCAGARLTPWPVAVRAGQLFTA